MPAHQGNRWSLSCYVPGTCPGFGAYLHIGESQTAAGSHVQPDATYTQDRRRLCGCVSNWQAYTMRLGHPGCSLVSAGLGSPALLGSRCPWRYTVHMYYKDLMPAVQKDPASCNYFWKRSFRSSAWAHDETVTSVGRGRHEAGGLEDSVHEELVHLHSPARSPSGYLSVCTKTVLFRPRGHEVWRSYEAVPFWCR